VEFSIAVASIKGRDDVSKAHGVYSHVTSRAHVGHVGHSDFNKFPVFSAFIGFKVAKPHKQVKLCN